MLGIVSSLFIFLITSPGSSAQTKTTFNVIDYGAVGNGQTDDTQAFLKAWVDVRGATQGIPTLEIPKGKTFMLQPVSFEGPCKSNFVHVQIGGTLVAPSMNAWKGNQKERWITFSQINGLIIDGGGLIDGKGASWWEVCKSNCQRPKTLSIHGCNGSQLSELSFLNSPMGHISINDCNGLHINNLNIRAPEDSPNTDGIDLSSSKNVNIENSFIGTGDDCIAIIGGSFNMNVTDINCGPGHGISIGSLGANGAFDTVEEVHVRNCHMRGTQNGVRIKTWEGGSGFARRISFDHITLEASGNPIIIDQHYIDEHDGNQSQPSQSSVLISDIIFNDVHGSSADEKAISLDCSDNSGCKNIILSNINITSSVPGKKLFSFCNNAHGSVTSAIPSVACLVKEQISSVAADVPLSVSRGPAADVVSVHGGPAADMVFF